MTAAYRKAHLAFCHNHDWWTFRQWAGMLFNDESRFNLHNHDGRYRVSRRQGERYDKWSNAEGGFRGGSVGVGTYLYHIVGNWTNQCYGGQIVGLWFYLLS